MEVTDNIIKGIGDNKIDDVQPTISPDELTAKKENYYVGGLNNNVLVITDDKIDDVFLGGLMISLNE